MKDTIGVGRKNKIKNTSNSKPRDNLNKIDKI